MLCVSIKDLQRDSHKYPLHMNLFRNKEKIPTLLLHLI